MIHLSAIDNLLETFHKLGVLILSLRVIFGNGALNGDYRVEIQTPDAEGYAKEGCSEAAPRANCGHKATIMVPEHFSSLIELATVENKGRPMGN
jgi:hypothetical protein